MAIEVPEAAYDLFFRRSPKPMYVFELGTLAFVDVNDAALALYDFDRGTFLSLTALDIRPSEEVGPFYASLRTGDPAHRLWRHRRSDGTEFLAEVDWTRHETAGVEVVVALVTDVTDRERSSERLARSEERLRSAVDLLLDGFNLFSPVHDEAGEIVDFRFEYANDASSAILGRPKEQLLGERILDLFPGAWTAEMLERYRHAIASGEPVEFETHGNDAVLGTGGERRIFNVRAARVGESLGIAFRDITADRKRQADRRRQAADATRRLAELSAREREILDLARREGATSREMARTLHISTRTVESHLASAYRKLRVASRTRAVAAYGELVDAATSAGVPN